MLEILELFRNLSICSRLAASAI